MEGVRVVGKAGEETRGVTGCVGAFVCARQQMRACGSCGKRGRCVAVSSEPRIVVFFFFFLVFRGVRKKKESGVRGRVHIIAHSSSCSSSGQRTCESLLRGEGRRPVDQRPCRSDAVGIDSGSVHRPRGGVPHGAMRASSASPSSSSSSTARRRKEEASQGAPDDRQGHAGGVTTNDGERARPEAHRPDTSTKEGGKSLSLDHSSSFSLSLRRGRDRHATFAGVVRRRFGREWRGDGGRRESDEGAALHPTSDQMLIRRARDMVTYFVDSSRVHASW